VNELTRELTRRERLVLMLRYTEELTVHEIAAVLEIATTEVERMLESIAERVRRRLAPVYARPSPRLG
jgi:DNA-directed RNA polymerase specialized sigma subunit